MFCKCLVVLAVFALGVAAIQEPPTRAMRIEASGSVKKVSTSPQDAPDLMDVYAENDKTRNEVKAWITPEVLGTALFNYGITPRWTEPNDILAKETLGPIQHDFLSQLGAQISSNGQQVNYLEIGVSVLKSIHTQSNFFHNGIISSLDIEDPNPVIEGRWADKKQVDSWLVSPTRKAHGRAQDYINQYSGPNSNTLYYQAGDAFDKASYEHFKKTVVAQHGPVNLVLSDGLHTGQAVATEVEMLISHGIIKPGVSFAMVWDDCSSGLHDAVFKKNFPKLRALFAGQATCSGKLSIPGWVGQNEFSHNTCVFTTLDLSGPHLGVSKTWIAKDSDVTCSPKADPQSGAKGSLATLASE